MEHESLKSKFKKIDKKTRVNKVLQGNTYELQSKQKIGIMKSLPNSPPKPFKGNQVVEDNSVAELIQEFNGIGEKSNHQELQEYLDSIKNRKDEDGEQLVVFPENFEQIVGLMNQQDMEQNQYQDSHWSNTLLKNGLRKVYKKSKGSMKVQDDDLSKANVKLAKGIAATRKLDRLLMETEKKNVKPNKSTVEEQDATFLTQGLADNDDKSTIQTTNKESEQPARRKSTSHKIPGFKIENGEFKHHEKSISKGGTQSAVDSMTTSNTNFIQRNREQVQPKSELTEEEKARIEHLLKEDNKTPSKQDQQQTGVNKVDSDAAARMKSIDAKLKDMMRQRLNENVPLDDDIIEYSADPIQQSRNDRILAQRTKEINFNLEKIKQQTRDDISERPGTASSRRTTCTITPEVLPQLLHAAKNELADGEKASSDDIRQLLIDIDIQIGAI